MTSPDQHDATFSGTSEKSDAPRISLKGLRKCYEDLLWDAQKIVNLELLMSETRFAFLIQSWQFWMLVDPQDSMSEHERGRAWRNSGLVRIWWTLNDVDDASDSFFWTPTQSRVPFDTTPDELTDLVRSEVYQTLQANASFQQYLRARKKFFRAQVFVTIYGQRNAYLNRDVFGRTRVARLADSYPNDTKARNARPLHTVVVEITMTRRLESLRFFGDDEHMSEETRDHHESTRQAQAYAALGLCRAPGSHTQTPPILDFQIYEPPPRPACASKLRENTRSPVVLDIMLSNHSEIAELDVPVRVKMQLTSATGDAHRAILTMLYHAYDDHCKRRHRRNFSQHIQSIQAQSRLYAKSHVITTLFVIPQKPSRGTAKKRQPMGVRRAHFFHPSMNLETFLDGVSERTLDVEAHLLMETATSGGNGWPSMP